MFAVKCFIYNEYSFLIENYPVSVSLMPYCLPFILTRPHVNGLVKTSDSELLSKMKEGKSVELALDVAGPDDFLLVRYTLSVECSPDSLTNLEVLRVAISELAARRISSGSCKLLKQTQVQVHRLAHTSL